MGKSMYAVVGSWYFRPGPKGITVLEYCPETGALKALQTKYRRVNADYMYLDQRRGMAYVADACATPRGGYVVALKIDRETGDFEAVCREETLFRDPNYVCIENQTSKYVFVTHHSNLVLVNRLIHREDGSFDVFAQYDDVGLVVFRLKEDGSFDRICDVALTSTDELVDGEHQYSRQHSVVEDPSGKILVVCDKGLEKIYTYRFDLKTEKLVFLSAFELGGKYGPRYGLFHPELPVYYCSCEKKLVVLSFRYDVDTGELVKLKESPIVPQKPEGEFGYHEKPESGDIAMNVEKKVVYVTVRGLNEIAVLRMKDDGDLIWEQSVDCGGKNPRCICISPDGRFLLCGNLESEEVRTFQILEDGRLRATELAEHVSLPSCIGIL